MTNLGAAAPKHGHAIKPRRRTGLVSCECQTCGPLLAATPSYTPRQVAVALREGTRAGCDQCGGLLIPRSVDDCERFTPWLLRLHSDYREREAALVDADLRRADREGKRLNRGVLHCGYCGEVAPINASGEVWHCRRCHSVNSYRPDGSVASCKAGKVGGYLTELAAGLSSDKPTARRVKAREPERYVSPDDTVDDLPF